MIRKETKKNVPNTLNVKITSNINKGRNTSKKISSGTTDQPSNIPKLKKTNLNNIGESNKNTIDHTKTVSTLENEKVVDGTKIDIKISVNLSEKLDEKKKVTNDKLRIIELKKNNKSFNNLQRSKNLNSNKSSTKSNECQNYSEKKISFQKRNISGGSEIIQNNLNISLFTGENNGKIDNFFKSPNKILSNSFAFNNNLMNRISNPSKTEVHNIDKIASKIDPKILDEQTIEESASRDETTNKDGNTINFTQTQTLQTEHTQQLSKKSNDDLTKYFRCLNKRFDSFLSLKSQSNINQNEISLHHNNSVNKLKTLFEELTNSNKIKESNIFFSKLNNCFTDLSNSLIMQCNNILNQKNKENEILKKKYNELSSKFIESAIALEEKDKIIKKLKEKIMESQILKSSEKIIQPITETVDLVLSEESMKFTESIEIDNEKNKLIRKINKENIDDLEAIYFYDKVHMRSNSENEFKVPRLKLNLALEKLKKIKVDDAKKESQMFNSPVHDKNNKISMFNKKNTNTVYYTENNKNSTPLKKTSSSKSDLNLNKK